MFWPLNRKLHIMVLRGAVKKVSVNTIEPWEVAGVRDEWSKTRSFNASYQVPTSRVA